MKYNMLLYLKNSGSNQRKTKTAIIDCCLSLRVLDYCVMYRQGAKSVCRECLQWSLNALIPPDGYGILLWKVSDS